MDRRRILILGGYGNLGKRVSALVLRNTDAHVVVCGRNKNKSCGLASQLGAEFGNDRVSATEVDAGDVHQLEASLAGVDLLVAAITGGGFTDQIVRAAVAKGVDCIDLRYPQNIVAVLKALEPAIREGGRCYFTQAGHLPGMASVLIRCAAKRFGALTKVELATVMSVPSNESLAAAVETVEIVQDLKSRIYVGGAWVHAGLRLAKRFDLGEVFGTRLCIPTDLAELNGLPEELKLQEAGVYVGGINWFVDAVVIPAAMLLPFGITCRVLGRWMKWGVNTFAKPPFGAVFKMEANRQNGGLPAYELTAYHSDSYYFAAAAATAGLLQYLDGSLGREPGVHIMGHDVDPERFVSDMAKFGVDFAERRRIG